MPYRLSKLKLFLKSALPYALLLLLVAGLLAWAQPSAPLQTPAVSSPANLAAVSGSGVGEVSLSWTPAAG